MWIFERISTFSFFSKDFEHEKPVLNFDDVIGHVKGWNIKKLFFILLDKF